MHQKTGNNYQCNDRTFILSEKTRNVDIERKNELFITMTLTREQLYQIYEDFRLRLKLEKERGKLRLK